MSGSLKSSLLYERNFRWRATEISRLEGFSDAVFAFAVTLLVVSLEVPKSFTELIGVMKGFVAFGICFAMLVLVWKEHTVFFRRYGLQSPLIVVLNSALLFLVLLYVYPLKFLFGFIVAEFSHGALSTMSHGGEAPLTQAQIPALMVMYGLGLSAVYLIFVLLYTYAYRRRQELQLNDSEVFLTRRSIVDHSAMMASGIVSTVLAVSLPSNLVGLSGMVYWLIPVYFTVARMTFGRSERATALRQSKSVSSARTTAP
jgi:uncharacterized membrane protein